MGVDYEQGEEEDEDRASVNWGEHGGDEEDVLLLWRKQMCALDIDLCGKPKKSETCPAVVLSWRQR